MRRVERPRLWEVEMRKEGWFLFILFGTVKIRKKEKGNYINVLLWFKKKFLTGVPDFIKTCKNQKFFPVRINKQEMLNS